MGRFRGVSLTVVFLTVWAVCSSEVQNGWGEWSECSVSCGDGLQTQEKFCDGWKCDTNEASCNMKRCDDPLETTPWSDCSESCDGGIRTRTVPGALPEEQNLLCNMHSCSRILGDCRADVVFVLDSSGSIGFMDWFRVKQFVMDVVHGLKVMENQTRVGVVSFATTVRPDFQLEQFHSLDRILPVIWDIDYMAGVTNTAAGLRRMHKMFKQHRRSYVKQIAIVLTDGQSNINSNTTLPNAQVVKQDKIEIFTIGVGPKIDAAEVRGIASDPHFVYNVSSYKALKDILAAITAMTCHVASEIQCSEKVAPCSETCGVVGVRTLRRHCKRYERTQMVVMEEFDEEEDIVCFTPCQTPTPTPGEATTTTKPSLIERRAARTQPQEPSSTTTDFGRTADHESTPIENMATSEPTAITTEYYDTTPTLEYLDTTPTDEYHDTTPTDEYHDTTPTDEYHDTTPTDEYHDTTPTDEYHDTTPTDEYHESTPTDETATSEPTVVTPAVLSPDDCRLCDFTKGQIWLPDRNNCHMFYVCEPIGYLEYRKHHMTCGVLWWQQDVHTCVMEPPVGCDVTAPVVTYEVKSTTRAPCPYEPIPNNETYFRSIDSPSDVQECTEGMIFMQMPCGCVPFTDIIPTCSSDLLLYFPYEDHYNDVTCHQAIATQYGAGVYRKYDANRSGNVACFNGSTHFEVSFLRTWFAQNEVNNFSIAVWFQREGSLSPPAAIVNNRNCKQVAGFSLSCPGPSLSGSIMTDTSVTAPPSPVTDNLWHHAAWVYDGSSLTMYLDGVWQSLNPVEGFMQNNDEPMHIGNDCDKDYFVGCLDELRVYERPLSKADIDNLVTGP